MAAPRSIQNNMLADGLKLDNLPADTNAQLALKVDKTTTVNGQPLSGNVTLTKSDVGLENVDNTSDVNKPISTATQTALDGKLDSVVAGTNITVDNTDPNNPIISSTGGSGTGDVTGPASSTDNAVARFDSTTGKIIQNSGAIIDDSGNITANNLSGTNTGDDKTAVTGVLKGNGTAISAAVAGTDYISPTGVETLTNKTLTDTDSIDFDTTAGVTVGTAQMAWNTDENTVDLGLTGNVTLQIGQESLWLARNNTGSQIDNGSVVYATGTIGASGRITIGKYIADGSISGMFTLGIVTEDIANGADGFVTHFGKVRGIDTTGAPVSEVWADGDVLYASPTTAGALTKVKPAANDVIIPIAFVVKAHSNGTLAVRVPTVMSPASDIFYDNTTSGLTSFDVKSAIDELTSEKANLAGATFTGKIITATPAAGLASINLAPSSAVDPSTPSSGDLWFNGTNLNFYNGSTTTDLLAGGGLSWNSSINGATGTGLALTMNNSYAAGGIGQSITIGDTQTNALTALSIDTGTSTVNNFYGIRIDSDVVSYGGRNGLAIFDKISATQAVGIVSGIRLGRSFNTNSSFSYKSISITNEQNAGSSMNTGIQITNSSTEIDLSGASVGVGSGSGIGIYQNGVGGTSFAVYGRDSVNSSTNGLVNYTLSNTQSGATVMQKIDLGTSAQGHKGLLINVFNASTSARGIKIDPSTTGTGVGIEFPNRGAGWTGIKWTNYLTGNSTGYGIYQNGISAGSGTGYGFYQLSIANSDGTSYGWYVANIGGETTGNSGKYFSLNNAQSGNLQDRTNDAAEILWSRTSTITTGTDADNFNLVNLRRTSVMNGSGGTFTAAGSVLKLENVATQTAGTLTDSVAVLSLVQDNDSTGGHILFNSYSGTPTANGTFWFDGTDLKFIAGGTTYTINKT